MLRLQGARTATLWESLLPEDVRVLPADLAALDELLADPLLLAPFRAHWEREITAGVHRLGLAEGRPTIPMETYLRLMILKHRHGWGYESLVREVADSFHLRRFCLLDLVQAVPEESTVRKLTRRLGPEVTDELIRCVIDKAVRTRRFRARALRVDSTVTEADIRYPTDVGLAGDAVKMLARVAKRVRAAVPAATQKVRDRSRAVGKRAREIGRTLSKRTGQAKQAVQRLTEQSAGQVKESIREARNLLAQARRSRSHAKHVSATARAKVIAELDRVAGLADRVVEQVRKRFANEKVTDRLVSLHDTDARPVRRGKLAKPTEFGYVMQMAEVTRNTKKGARGLLLPPKLQPGSTHENTLLDQTVKELETLGLAPKEAVFDAGFAVQRTTETMHGVNKDMHLFIAGNEDNEGSRRTRRRRARFRVGCEGRISHAKREYGAGRSRLKGEDGAHIWEGWSFLAYNLDTVAARQSPTR